MLQVVEVLPGHRRSLRRSVELEADVIASRWSRPRLHRAVDVSPDGMRVAAASRLPKGEVVGVRFVPPGWWLHGSVSVFARVARSAPRLDADPAWMGLEFLDLPAGVRLHLERGLVGRPPPLPRLRRRRCTEHLWVEQLVTWTEDLGDRVSTYEVSATMRAIDDDEITVRPLGPLV